MYVCLLDNGHSGEHRGASGLNSYISWSNMNEQTKGYHEFGKREPYTCLTERERRALAEVLRLSAEVRRQAEALAGMTTQIKDTIDMSTTNDPIQTFATQEAANLTAAQAAINSIATGVTNLDNTIVQLEAQIAAGSSTLTAADQTLLTNLVAQSSALVAQAQAVSTTPPAAPTA
jgi:K+/H+ antiporter YhaU regulatory subunit KhtT